MKKQLLEISKTLGAVVGIITALSFFAKPFLEDYVDERIDNRISSPATLEKALKSPYMLDYKINQKNIWREAELNREDSRIKFSSTLVSKTGMNKEAVEDTLANIILNHSKKFNYITNEDCILNSKKYGRGINRLIRQ